MITYANELKVQLGVDKKVLQDKGAVSKEVALQMAKQAREQFNTDYALSITGVAGPSSAGSKKPAGLVMVALAGPKKTKVTENLFWGDRHQVRQRSVYKSLEMLRRELI